MLEAQRADAVGVEPPADPLDVGPVGGEGASRRLGGAQREQPGIDDLRQGGVGGQASNAGDGPQ